MIAAFCDGHLLAPFTEGACNRTVFETWLKTCLIPGQPHEKDAIVWGKVTP